MKRIKVILLAVILIPVLIFLALNIDIGSVPGDFTQRDLKPASLEKDNGFYRYLTLVEPAEVDVETAGIREKYRTLCAPDFEEQQENENTGADTWGSPQKLGDYLKNRKKINKETDVMSNTADFSYYDTKDVVTVLIPRLKAIEKLVPRYDYLLRRYERLINSPKIEDFRTPAQEMPKLPITLLYRLMRFYSALKINQALKGDWPGAIRGLLAQLDFGKRLADGSRFLGPNFNGKAVMRYSVAALNGLMNHKECPKEVYTQIFEGMPPLKPSQYRLGWAYVGHYLYLKNEIKKEAQGADKILRFFCLQENRTMKYCLDYVNLLMKYEKIPMYKWKLGIKGLAWKQLSNHKLWWVRNAVGKQYADTRLSIRTFTYRVFSIKTYYDLTRLSAELHMAYTPDKPVKEILENLESYKEPDPCSGKPYMWNEKESLLYGVSMDGKDNKGSTRNNLYKGYDFAIECKLR
ncbi:MAG: hypothetical protein GY757_22560 [bacterium]|nr:hypothetical protein [bacterium]